MPWPGKGGSSSDWGLSAPASGRRLVRAAVGAPRRRLADYVHILRKAWRREEALVHDGEELQLPYRGAGASGLGKPLRSILHARPDIPIWLATGAAAHVRLTAELADGWLPFGFVPGMMGHYREALEQGFANRGGRPSDFEIQASCQVLCTEDVRAALERQKALLRILCRQHGARASKLPQAVDGTARLRTGGRTGAGIISGRGGATKRPRRCRMNTWTTRH